MRLTTPRLEDYFMLKNATYLRETNWTNVVEVEVRVYPKDEVVTVITSFAKSKSYIGINALTIYVTARGLEEAEVRIATVLKQTYPQLTCVGIEHYDN